MITNKISIAMQELKDVIKEQGLHPEKHNVHNDEDMIEFALYYLQANVDHAFEELDEL